MLWRLWAEAGSGVSFLDVRIGIRGWGVHLGMLRLGQHGQAILQPLCYGVTCVPDPWLPLASRGNQVHVVRQAGSSLVTAAKPLQLAPALPQGSIAAGSGLALCKPMCRCKAGPPSSACNEIQHNNLARIPLSSSAPSLSCTALPSASWLNARQTRPLSPTSPQDSRYSSQ